MLYIETKKFLAKYLTIITNNKFIHFMQMRATIITLILIISGNIYSQKKTDNRQVYFGPKMGLDIVTSSSNSIEEQLKSNFQVGGFMQVGNKFYIQPEAYYSSYSISEGSTKRINYFKMPLMLGYRVLDLRIASLHINGGPTYHKQLNSSNSGKFNWELGVGADVFGLITTDIRYTFKRGSTNGITQIEQLLSNGGVVNLTFGIKL